MIPEKATRNVFFLHILLGITGVLLVAFIGITSYLIRQEKKLGSRVYPNVYVDDIELGFKTKEQALELVRTHQKVLSDTLFTVLYKNEPVATFSASQIHLRYNTDEVVDRAYLIGRVEHVASRVQQKWVTLFNLSRYDFQSHLAYDTDLVKDFFTSVEQKYEKPAKNALFKFEDNRVVAFQPEVAGLAIDSTQFFQDLNSQIQKLEFQNTATPTITLVEHVVKPQVTLAQVNQFGIEELIGEGKSDFSHSIPERIHNIVVAASKFNGVLIPRGGEFSFNDTIGDISSTTGYKPAYIIKNGRTVLGDGGGVCQVSTTVFRAALNTGLPIVERHAHAYRVGYYENDAKPGLDATVFSPTVDLKIKNDTQTSILVQTEIERDTNILHVRLYGKKDNRRVELSAIQVYDVTPPPPDVHQDDPTMKKGQTKQVDFAAWGSKSLYTYKVTYPDGKVEDKSFLSVYRPWAAVFLVGTSDI